MDFKALGAQLKAARMAKGLSVVQLSKTSGVSRRHIGLAEGGSNITLNILQKLLAALDMTEVSLGKVNVSAIGDGLNPATLLVIAGEMSAVIRRLSAAVDALRAYAEGRPAPEIAKAAALIREVTAGVKKSARRVTESQKR
jgi:transcriptional regulator with XRE-family HTH domain